MSACIVAKGKGGGEELALWRVVRSRLARTEGGVWNRIKIITYN